MENKLLKITANTINNKRQFVADSLSSQFSKCNTDEKVTIVIT